MRRLQGEFNWPLLGQQAGLGLVLGLAVGYSLKKALRAALLLLGALTAVLVGLGRMGFVTVHWEAVERSYTRALAEAGGPSGAMERIIAWFSSSIAVSGSFVVGFWLGFRMG